MKDDAAVFLGQGARDLGGEELTFFRMTKLDLLLRYVLTAGDIP